MHFKNIKKIVMKKVNFLKIYLIAIIIFLLGCETETIPLSSENTLDIIAVNDGKKDMVGNISGSNITFRDSAVAKTTQVMVKLIRFSDKASANVNINEQIPLKKTITITAENGSTKNYVMSINVSTATTTGSGMTMTGNPVGTITGMRLTINTIMNSGVVLSGSFTKLNNPYITEMGILVTTNAMNNLELTSDNEAPTGATKHPADLSLLLRINNPVNTDITFPFPLSNLRYGAPHSFRGYAIINGAVVYSNILRAATLVSYTPIPDDNFRNAILSCINSNGRTTLSGDPGINFTLNCTESFEGTISASGNSIRTAALVSITEFNYGQGGQTNDQKIRSISGIEQMIHLTRLNVRDNFLSSFDVSRNTALTLLIASDNSLSSLDVSKNTALNELLATSSNLRSLHVSVNTALTRLELTNNLLSSLYLYANTALTRLDVEENLLTILDISRNTALNTLIINNSPSLTCIKVDASQLVGGENYIFPYSQILIRGVLKDAGQTLVSGSCMTGG